MKDVHTEHCCARHGCKYSNDDCTVVTGKAPQSYPCEWCDCEKEEATSFVERIEYFVSILTEEQKDILRKALEKRQ